MTKIFLRKLKFAFLLFMASMVLSHCGPQGPGSVMSCTPNVIDNGMSLLVTSIGGNVYTFQLCSATVPSSAVYSVYGGPSLASLNAGFNVNAAQRQPVHIAGANSSGSNFQITFQGSDVYFSIYQDLYSGGVYNLDNSTTPMVSPHRLPGR